MKDFTQKWKQFHEGKLSGTDAKSFLEHLNSPEGKVDFQKLLKMIWEAENVPERNESTPAGKSSNLNSFNRQKKREELKNHKPGKQLSVLTWIRYAASLIAIILILKEWGLINPNSSQQGNFPLVKETEWVIKSNPKGIKSRILLPDSSLVFLNADSQIRYPRDFTINRRVILTGEAFFDVRKREGKPFYVQAGPVSTTVLGTSFNVNTDYLESIEIALATGKVRILNENTGKDILLQPGEAGKISRTTQSIQIFDVDPSKISLWKEGILHFDKEPFQLVIKKLENWYGVQISVKGEIPNELCSGTFQKKAYLSDVLNVLGHSLRFEFDLNGKNVAIYPSLPA
ncbi:MAG: DUF4974 domain-containing protein [Cyclobacterium sp.]|uniref:FecR family protein n=1 Tax=unclassified Cyclobacterium TaxID=2615055 RepID=UPI0013D5E657|nr:FecR family protein [Cyclobacterium sp. SYSU L10401]